MGTQIKIHRGNQIGGCVTEIWTSKTRILIDFGEELPGSENEKPVPVTWGESKSKKGKIPAVSAVFFTHYHGDHIGRFAEVPDGIPLYMSGLSKDVLTNIHGYLAENLPKLAKFQPEQADQLREDAGKHKAALEALNGGRVYPFQPKGKEENAAISIGEDLFVTPYWVDHSAADACMFLIETPDKRILHTGDFRGHGVQGRGGEDICGIVRRLKAEGGIDSLIIEGTMMSRQDEKLYSEADLRDSANRLFAEHRHVFLIVSSTNLDSISTFYQAAEEAAPKKIPMYTHNFYAEEQVRTLGVYAHAHDKPPKRPAMDDVERVRPWDEEQIKAMRKDGFVTIIKGNDPCRKLVEEFTDCKPVIVYSMWQGYYLRGLDKKLCDFIDTCKEKKIPVCPLTDPTYGPLHTAGHASPALIARILRAADPGEIRPIHTENAGGFLDLDISDGLKDRIVLGDYRKEKDHRCLCEAALAKFLPGGSHRAFVELVRDRHPGELTFCLRGNSGNAAVIYYRNHMVFRILSQGNVQFDFGHARYTGCVDENREELRRLGFRMDEEQTEGLVPMPAKEAAGKTLEDLEDLYSRIKPMIDTFSEQKKLTEKSVQHQLFLHPGWKKLRGGYYLYDLEFSQPYGKLLGCRNQPDMLAVRFDENGKPERLVFVEVKSKPEALDGMSGLAAHIRGMERYPEWLLPIRSRDAYHILKQYRRLGLPDAPDEDFREEDFQALPKEILLIFTGEAIDALGKEKGEQEPRFLREMGYTWLEIDPKDKPLPMEVYHKDCDAV